MAMYVTPILEFSRDPLSDTTPTWVDVTQYLLRAAVATGIGREGDEPNAGQAEFVLRNQDRRFEPDYTAGAFYPDVQDMRRFRFRIQNGVGSGTIYGEGIWYVTSWQPTWPDDAIENQCVVKCVDGFGVLALDDLPQLDPPDATSYADVVEADEPWGYWQLGEPEGTRARANIIRGRHTVRRGGEKVQRKFRRRRGTVYSTRAEAGAASGPSGTYKNTPALGVAGAIVGSSDTAVSFASASSEFVTFTLDDTDDTVRTNQLTLEAWVKPTGGFGTAMGIVGGPLTGGGVSVWALSINGSGKAVMDIDLGDAVQAVGATTLTLDAWQHVAGTWNGAGLQVWVDGQLDGESSFGGAGPIPTPSGATFTVGRYHDGSGTARYFNGTLDEVAVYEGTLSPERVLAHYQAGAERGFPQQTAGARIAALATHALWSETSIQTAGRDVQPAMQHGQSRLDEISELAHAEGPRAMFFFNGAGDPVYLGHEWQATSASYNTSQATFGNLTGEKPYETVDVVNDNETYNDVTVSHEAGELVNAVDATSVGQRGRRANVEWTDVLLMEHNHVESLANAVLAFYKDPQLRFDTMVLSGADSATRDHIFARQIGHMIRVKHRPNGGTAIDRACNIIGRTLTLDEETGHLTCEWNLSRGFNAAAGVWRAGIVGFSEAGSTTVAG